MSNQEPIAAGRNGALEALCARVEEIAVALMLGNPDGTDRVAILRDICEKAEAAGRADVACMVKKVLAAASRTTAAELDGLLSGCITGVQQALRDGAGETVSCAAEPAGPSASLPDNASAPASLGQDRELLGEFILESRDHLAQVELQMITLEKDPADSEAINTVFRAVHTIKGLAGFLDLGDIGDVAHQTETLLDLARNRKLVITAAVVDVVLAAADFLKAWLLRVEKTLAGDDAGPVPEEHVLLDRIHREGLGETKPQESLPEQPKPPTSTTVVTDAEPPRAPRAEWTGPERRVGEDRRTQAAEAHFVKVDTAKLDFLVDMAGEMVIAESMVRHHPELTGLHSPAVLHRLAQLARITSDLQKTAMSMRMVPISGLFQKMNRMVRDLGRKTGKQAELETIGGETELDRNVVEELADPLMHMVRNAVDHGLESADERLAAGKDPVGRIGLRACHQAGHIVIEITDDGRGLNRDRILEKARSMGLVEQTGNLSESEIFDLIFQPGFSTAAEVTDVSGRGVGLDVVKKRIQKLRGHVDIQSTPGRQTSFFLRMPLTLAIIDGLVVGVGSERYVVPIFSVREMLRPSPEMVFTVEGRHEMALVRGNLLPVVRLYRRFGVQPRSQDPAESLLIVAEAAGRSFCLLVDNLIGKQEVVIKSLGYMLRDIPGVAGGAILGDGRVGLILDLEGIFCGRGQ